MVQASDESDFAAYMHPWCNRLFMIKKKYLKIQASPQMCCIEHCEETEPNNCDIASKKWNNHNTDEE